MLSKKYQSAIETSTAFMAKIEDLVREIAIQSGIPYYRIESQMAHYPHMGAEDTYMPVIRVITYFEDTVGTVADILQNEFDIVMGRSIDKKKNRLDSFSYKHTQCIASLKSNRRNLTEYKRCGDKKFEIQLCSMLQDAWSGIEKELGYDNAAFPEESKRDFFKVGALLEMADSEFLKMRTATTISQDYKYEEPVRVQEIAHEEVTTPAYNMETEQPVNTFEEHLQAVAHEVPEVAEPVQPEVVYVAPVVEETEVVVNTVIEEPVHEVVAEPTAHMLSTFAALSLVPKKAIQGLAPQRVAIPVASGIVPQRVAAPAAKAHTTEMKVDSNGTLAINETPAASKNYIVEETVAKIADIVNVGSLVEQPAPAPQEEPKPVVNVVTPVEVPQNIPPVVNNIIVAAPVVEAPAAKAENNYNVSTNVNGISGKTPDQIRDQVAAAAAEKAAPFYEDQVKSNRVAIDENAPMTDVSLREYVLSSKLLKEIDMRIAERAGAKINAEIDIEGDVERLRFLKVFTLKQLHDRLTDNKNDIVAFAEKWIGKDNGGSFDSGISLFYLEYLLVGKKNDPAFAIEYVVKFISDNDYSARYIIPTYNSIRNAEVPNNFSHLTLKA